MTKKIQVSNRKPYNEEWDKLLNLLLEKGVVDKSHTSNHTLRFKLKVCEEFKLFKMFKAEKFKTYDVWISNKDWSYGYLYAVDGKNTRNEYRPSQSTLDKLLNKELEVKEVDYEYKIPKYYSKEV